MNYAKIKHYDIANGEGVRMSLFVSGCNFHCPNCFNAEAQNFNCGQPYTAQTEEEIIKLIDQPKIAGLSLLGGDPLWQKDDDIDRLIALVKRVKALGKTAWIWSGFTWEQLSGKRKELVDNCDVFIDGLFIEAEKDYRLRWAGSRNQRVIDVKRSREKGEIILYA